MYKSIHLNSSEIDFYKIISEKEITKLSKINIFIGANNSGKSKFLRGIFSNQDIEFTVKTFDLSKINNAITELKTEIKGLFETNRILRTDNVDYNQFDLKKYLSSKIDLKLLYNQVDTLAKAKTCGSISFMPNSASVSPDLLISRINQLSEKCLTEIEPILSFDRESIKYEHIYIPTLRGLRGIDYTNNDLSGRDNYLTRTKKDYFNDSLTTGRQIYTGLSLYNDVKHLLLGSREDREKIKKFENFLSQTFFDNKEFSIIPSIKDNVVHVNIGNDEDLPIYKLGDGIQSIIILTYPLFFNQEKNMCIFFEEPDLFLHPGYQRIFIETLMKKEFSDFQFFLTTHSNHFLDMTLDFDSISVYTFRKNENKDLLIENVKNDDNNILELLGIKNSSVFLSNCTIWVEGITDRIYLRKYLEVYKDSSGKQFLEDIHYSFVEYGGNNITHWSFLDSDDTSHKNINVERLCSKLFLITDKDGVGLKKNGEKKKKVIRQENLEKQLDKRYYCLKAREIENLLTENIIINTIKDLEKKDCTAVDFSKIKFSKYENLPLGDFIDKNVSGISKTYAAESGTVKDKIDFAKKAVLHIQDINDLSEEGKDLTQKLYNFIKENNPK